MCPRHRLFPLFFFAWLDENPQTPVRVPNPPLPHHRFPYFQFFVQNLRSVPKYFFLARCHCGRGEGVRPTPASQVRGRPIQPSPRRLGSRAIGWPFSGEFCLGRPQSIDPPPQVVQKKPVLDPDVFLAGDVVSRAGVPFPRRRDELQYRCGRGFCPGPRLLSSEPEELVSGPVIT